jgi:peroxiredoxin
MLPEVGRWQGEREDKLTVALVSRGKPEENETKAQEHGLKNVVLQKDWEVSEAYRVSGTPSAVLIAAEGTIASPVAGGVEAIEDLAARAVGERPQFPIQQPQAQGRPCPNCGKVHPNGNGSQQAVPAKVKVGEPAPEVKLVNLDGKTVELKDFRGQETLVLFWNPGCGFCQQMLPDIKELEASPREDAPKLLFVSGGTEEANRQMKLTSTVVLDQQFAVGRAFGASGTPSAVLVDAKGNVASEVAVGAPGVLELAGKRRAEA